MFMLLGGGATYSHFFAVCFNKHSKIFPAKRLLFIGILFNLSLIGIFKYTDFLLENFNLFISLCHFDFHIPLPHILLPLAVSFFTFQQIAFLVDCYKSIESNCANKDSRLDFFDYCLFVLFFPQLIAGPIVHHKEMMPQFSSVFARTMDSKIWENIAKGLYIFSIGLFKKVFIADSFAQWANSGFAKVESGEFLNIAESWATSLSYTFQIYFDFSGYCDMAIGLALLFGIRLPINFNAPYKSQNISDFWRRWHMTLGRFMRDYLYIPLGGNQRGMRITLRNLFIVSFLSGIWHGAGFGFIIWGILHGIAMCAHRIYARFLETKSLRKSAFLQSRIYHIFCWILTFNFINVSWIFFRSENISGALNLLKSMFGIVWVELPQKWWRMGELLAAIDGKDKLAIFTIVAFIVVLYCKNSIEMLKSFNASIWNAAIVGFFLFLSILLLFSVPYTEFIYFNF